MTSGLRLRATWFSSAGGQDGQRVEVKSSSTIGPRLPMLFWPYVPVVRPGSAYASGGAKVSAAMNRPSPISIKNAVFNWLIMAKIPN